MTSHKNIKLPQEGTATNSGGESLTGSFESVCPSYSGGGNDRYGSCGSFDHNDDHCNHTDTDLATDAGVKEVFVDRLLLVKKTNPTKTRKTRARSTRCPTPGAEDTVAQAKKNLSDSESDMSCETVTSQASLPSNRFWRKRARDVPASGSSEDLAPSAKTPVKRGRGRPPTTGQYVGLAKAKAQLNAAKAEELRLQAESEMAEEVKRKRETRAAIFRKSPVLSQQARNEPESLDLEKVVGDSLATILQVAKSSKNLKGTFVRALNEAADALKVSFTELRVRTATEEVARLEAANAKLAAELAEIRKEMAQLQPPVAQTPTPTADEIVRAVMTQCGAMINSRFENLEGLLLPERRLRPPLAADRRRSSATAEAAARTSIPRETSPPRIEEVVEATFAVATKKKAPKKAPKAPPAPESRKTETKRTAEPQPPPTRAQSRPKPRSQPADEGWTDVPRSGKPRKAKRKGMGSSRQPPAKKAPKLRAPRSTAVVLTLQPKAVEQGITYGRVLLEAKQRVDMQELGIDGVLFRTTATGARLLKIPGAASAEKANALASKLREAIGEEVVRVTRPEKCVELRVVGLDDSATKEEVVEAVAKTGGCAVEAIRAGEIVRQAGRQQGGSVWLRCPVAAAKKAAQKRLLVGWVSVRAIILEPRPPRCFRCLEPGHLGVNCTVGVDRSQLCFRCGKEGHSAAHCTAEPHCPVCEAAGKPANHRVGTRACSATPSKKGKGKGGEKPVGDGPRAPSPPAQRPKPRAEKPMDTTN